MRGPRLHQRHPTVEHIAASIGTDNLVGVLMGEGPFRCRSVQRPNIVHPGPEGSAKPMGNRATPIIIAPRWKCAITLIFVHPPDHGGQRHIGQRLVWITRRKNQLTCTQAGKHWQIIGRRISAGRHPVGKQERCDCRSRQGHAMGFALIAALLLHPFPRNDPDRLAVKRHLPPRWRSEPQCCGRPSRRKAEAPARRAPDAHRAL